MLWYHDVLCQKLDAWLRGDITRLMVFMPPQHGKSALVSRLLPAYILGTQPNAKVLAASYAADLIQGMNRDVQRFMDSDPYRVLFPATQLNSKNIRSLSGTWLRNNDTFEVVGRRGAYRCAGIGGSLTGFPADFGVIDDVHKDPPSLTDREQVFEWYVSVWMTRLHSTSRQLITLTRWHEDDLAGRLLDREGDAKEGGLWTVVSFKAVREDDHNPDDPREIGEALWPEKHGLELLEQKRRLNPRQFEAMYQQSPRAREGNFFTLTGLPIHPVAPSREQMTKLVRYWDLGGSDSKKADSTQGVLMCRTTGGEFAVLDCTGGQWSPAERNERIRHTCEKDRQQYGAVETWIEKVPGLGIEVIDNLVRHLAGYTVHTEMARADKTTRADPLASQCEAGNVWLLEGAWNAEYRDELTMFPNGKHDDRVDASSGAFSKCAGQSTFSLEWL